MGLKQDRIIVVTGASRGAGKGIALALAGPGTTVYVTGRTRIEGENPLPGTVQRTAEEINERGGEGIPVICDHSDDNQVADLFHRIERDHGRLDILVNNAFTIDGDLTKPGPFWQKSLSLQDVFNVGTRSSYVATWHAAPLLVNNGEGLVVNTSSFGGRCYMHGPAYGAGKAAVDKMAHDMAHDFRPHGIAAISLWMGMLQTERTEKLFESGTDSEQYKNFLANAESAEFPGRVIDALARDDRLMDRSGKVLIAAEIAVELGVTDLNGAQPPSHRGMLGDPPTFSAAVVE